MCCARQFEGEEAPHILIEVTGSAKHFKVRPRLKDLFSHGLATAAHATKAWIFTGGTDSGVMQFVGQGERRTPVGAPHHPSVASSPQHRIATPASHHA